MRIIGQFKAHVRKRLKDGEVKRQPFTPTRYWGIGAVTANFQECVELDLSAAYLTAAFKIGVMADWMYKRLYKLSKTSRLVTVGSLGTRKTVETYKEGKRCSVCVEYDHELREVWDRITAEVDHTMRQVQQAVGGGDFLFYWTDAVVVKTGAAPVVRECLEKAGYSWKEIHTRIRRYKNYVIAEDGRFFPISAQARQKDEPMMLEEYQAGMKVKEAMV